jgi:hypothetical protein
MTCKPERILVCTDPSTILKRKRFGYCDRNWCCIECRHIDDCSFLCPNRPEAKLPVVPWCTDDEALEIVKGIR